MGRTREGIREGRNEIVELLSKLRLDEAVGDPAERRRSPDREGQVFVRPDTQIRRRCSERGIRTHTTRRRAHLAIAVRADVLGQATRRQAEVHSHR